MSICFSPQVTQNCFPCFGTTCEASGADAHNKTEPTRTMPGKLWNNVCRGYLNCTVTALNINGSNSLAPDVYWSMTNNEGYSEGILVSGYDDDDTAFDWFSSDFKVLARCNMEDEDDAS